MAELNDTVVRNDDGTINVDESLVAFEEHLTGLMAQEEALTEGIAREVHAVFNLHLGVALPVPSLTSIVVQRLGVDYTQFKVMTSAVATYVRNNTAEFTIAKGKGGGARRNCDTPKK
jgi:hypothetical protein